MSKATSWSADELMSIEVPAAYLAAPPGSRERDYLPGGSSTTPPVRGPRRCCSIRRGRHRRRPGPDPDEERPAGVRLRGHRGAGHPPSTARPTPRSSTAWPRSVHCARTPRSSSRGDPGPTAVRVCRVVVRRRFHRLLLRRWPYDHRRPDHRPVGRIPEVEVQGPPRPGR